MWYSEGHDEHADMEWYETEYGGGWRPKAQPARVCTCGSKAVNGPGHSSWCDSLPNAPEPYDNKKPKLF